MIKNYLRQFIFLSASQRILRNNKALIRDDMRRIWRHLVALDNFKTKYKDAELLFHAWLLLIVLPSKY